MTVLEIVGKKYHRLTVKRVIRGHGKSRAECICDCGRTTIVLVSNVKNGNTKSCGCLAQEWRESKFINPRTTHGQTRGEHRRTYRIWRNMLNRCDNPNFDSFPWYGGRGIKICDRWRSFSNFFEDMGPAPVDMSLDRMDSNGDYEKENCRWATRKQQARNTRKNRLIQWRGQAKTLAEWAEVTGIHQSTISRRIDVYAWPVERALTEPSRRAGAGGVA